MKQLRSPRQLIKMWRRRGKAATGRLASAADAAPEAVARKMRSAFTDTGLSVEAQVRKAANSFVAGLALF
jgi:hypothetical protein